MWLHYFNRLIFQSFYKQLTIIISLSIALAIILYFLFAEGRQKNIKALKTKNQDLKKILLEERSFKKRQPENFDQEKKYFSQPLNASQPSNFLMQKISTLLKKQGGFIKQFSFKEKEKIENTQIFTFQITIETQYRNLILILEKLKQFTYLVSIKKLILKGSKENHGHQICAEMLLKVYAFK
jgi:hypothetical protein